MAHLPQDELPSEFDVVVDGTGLVQSILAAALARAGKTVLHLDRNTYYGELWGSLMHREMEQWMTEWSRDLEATTPGSHDPPCRPPDYSPSDGERILEIDRTNTPASVTNLIECIHTAVPADVSSSVGNEKDGDISEGVTGEGGDIGEDGVTGVIGEDGVTGAIGEDGVTGGGGEDGVTNEGGEGVSSGGNVDGEGGDTGDGATSTGCTSEAGEKTEPPIKAPPTTPESSKVTWQSLEPQRRRFNFDLLPKFMFCRGSMVDLITESSCSRYIEFRAVGGIYNYSNGSIEQVPCSRSDVFSSKVVSMLEKRKMMKFLTFCADFQGHPEEYEGSISLPFVEFLKQKQLTPNLVQYVLHSIAMVTENSTTLEGLQSTQTFINSLGRFGNAPFLFPIFGGGELPQAFCRLCAVFGGVYCLHRHVTSLITSTTDDSITSVICSSGQRIKCSSVIMSAASLTKTLDFRESLKITRLSRAILITDSALQGTDGKLCLLTLTPGSLGDTQTTAVRVIQLDPPSNSCPNGTFMVHMQCCSGCGTARQDLEPAARALFCMEDDEESNSSGPRVLWSVYYNVTLQTIDPSQTSTLECPRGLYVTSEPDNTIGYEKAANEARELFSQMCPGEDFLPHPPSPDDIILDDTADNHDNEGDTHEAKGDVPANQVLDSETPPTTTDAPPTNDVASSQATSNQTIN